MEDAKLSGFVACERAEAKLEIVRHGGSLRLKGHATCRVK